MSTDRLDAQVEVKVPAQNGRKAYSYFRNVSAAKKGAAGVGGALALGGLAAAAIALRKTPEESKAIPAPVAAPDPVVEPQSTASRVGEFAKKAVITTGKNVAGVATSLAISKGISAIANPIASKIMDEKYKAGSEARRAKWREEEAAAEEQYESYRKEKDLEARTIDVKAVPANETLNRLSPPKTKLEVGGALVPVNEPQPATPPIPSKLSYTPPTPKVSAGALTVAPSESGKASGSAIAEPNKTLLTKVAGSAGAAAGKLYRKTKEGLERDRVAREKLANRTVDVNDMTRKAGSATRSTINAVDNFARSFMQTFVDRNNTVDVSASEVKTTQREMPKRTRRANKTVNRVWNNVSRRYESFDQRIDSFIATRLLGES